MTPILRMTSVLAKLLIRLIVIYPNFSSPSSSDRRPGRDVKTAYVRVHKASHVYPLKGNLCPVNNLSSLDNQGRAIFPNSLPISRNIFRFFFETEADNSHTILYPTVPISSARRDFASPNFSIEFKSVCIVVSSWSSNSLRS